MKRPMSAYSADLPICPTCGKKMRSSDTIEFVDGVYRHAILCTAPPPREVYMARVAAKRAARLEGRK